MFQAVHGRPAEHEGDGMNAVAMRSLPAVRGAVGLGWIGDTEELTKKQLMLLLSEAGAPIALDLCSK